MMCKKSFWQLWDDKARVSVNYTGCLPRERSICLLGITTELSSYWLFINSLKLFYGSIHCAWHQMWYKHVNIDKPSFSKCHMNHSTVILHRNASFYLWLLSWPFATSTCSFTDPGCKSSLWDCIIKSPHETPQLCSIKSPLLRKICSLSKA